MEEIELTLEKLELTFVKAKYETIDTDWMRENVLVWGTADDIDEHGIITVIFRNSEDAILFKLKYGALT